MRSCETELATESSPAAIQTLTCRETRMGVDGVSTGRQAIAGRARLPPPGVGASLPEVPDEPTDKKDSRDTAPAARGGPVVSPGRVPGTAPVAVH